MISLSSTFDCTFIHSNPHMIPQLIIAFLFPTTVAKHAFAFFSLYIFVMSNMHILLLGFAALVSTRSISHRTISCFHPNFTSHVFLHIFYHELLSVESTPSSTLTHLLHTLNFSLPFVHTVGNSSPPIRSHHFLFPLLRFSSHRLDQIDLHSLPHISFPI